MKKLATNLSALAVAIAVATPVHAQLEEVVVTARRKSESIQDVPVAVTAIAGDDVEMSFTLDTTSLTAFAPNVVFDTIEMGTPGGGGFSIRGVSYQDVEKSYDPTVLVAVDDVPLQTGTGQVFDLLDIDRVEILRGPQGTLFGKNAVGGLVNIHRKRPELDETSGKIRVRGGEYEKYGIGGVFNYGGEEFAIKLLAQYDEQGEGFLDNGRRPDDPDQTPLSKSDVWTRDTEHYTAHLLWAPTDAFTGELILDHGELSGTPSPVFNMDKDLKDTVCLVQTFVLPGFPYCSGQYGEPSSLDRDRASMNDPGNNSLESDQATVRMNFDINDDYSVTYIGSWMQMDDDQRLDGDGTPYEIYEFRRWGDFEQTTNEIRLSRDSGSPLTWQVGAFSSTSESSTEQNSILSGLGLGTAGNPIIFARNNTKSDSYSFFGEAEYAMMDDQLVLIAGGRYIDETKSLGRGEYTYLAGSGDYTSTPEQYPGGVWNPQPGTGGTEDFNKWVYRFGARYHITDDVMVYATTSTGFRSGGFSPRASEPAILENPYDPEELTNYELGIKTTLLDGMMTFNATVFQMDYENMQVEAAIPSTTGTGTQTTMTNAGESEIQGAEIDFQWAVNDWWRLMGNVGLLDSEYKSFTADIYGDGIVADESNLTLRRAPELSWGLTSDVMFNVGGGELTWRITYSYTDEYEAYLSNYEGSDVKDAGILDSSITYSYENWQIAVFGRNLTDEDNWTHNYPVNPLRPTATDSAPGTFWRFGQRRPPSEIGAELLYKF